MNHGIVKWTTVFLAALFIQLHAVNAYSVGPITATYNGQIIEGIVIVSVGVPGITVNNVSNVTIRNVVIHHSNAPGISFSSANGLRIENVTIIHEGAPPTGYSPPAAATAYNILGAGSSGIVIKNVKVVRGIKGIYLQSSPGAQLSNIQAMDMRAVDIYPRHSTGHCINFHTSPGSLLEDFSCENDLVVSRTSDNVNVLKSNNVTIRRGLIVGNNQKYGAGIMFEGSSYGWVEDVDALQMGNGAFGAYEFVEGGATFYSNYTTFLRTRTKGNYCTETPYKAFSDFNGFIEIPVVLAPPSSAGRGWIISPNSLYASITDSQYPLVIMNPPSAQPCADGYQVWINDLVSNPLVPIVDFMPRAPQSIQQPWTSGDMTNNRCSAILVGNFDSTAGSDLLCNDMNAPYEKRVAVSKGELFWYGGVWSSWCGANAGTGDFNGDGKSDLYCNYGSWTDVMISTGSSFVGVGNWMYSGNFSIPQGCSQFFVGDYNGDGRSDILCHNDSTLQNRVMLSSGSSFIDAGVWGTWCGANFGVGDFNGDGKSDLYCNYGSWTDVMISTGSSFGGAGTGNWINSAAFSIPQSCSKFLVGDYNGDQRADILCHNDATMSNRVMLSSVANFFVDAGVWATWCGANVYAGDFNADGRADLLCDDGFTKWVNTSNGTSLIGGNPWFNF